MPIPRASATARQWKAWKYPFEAFDLRDMEQVAELELLRAQRAHLASQLKPRWWYVAGTVLAVAKSGAT